MTCQHIFLATLLWKPVNEGQKDPQGYALTMVNECSKCGEKKVTGEAMTEDSKRLVVTGRVV